MHTEVYEMGLKDFTDEERERFESYLYRMATNLKEAKDDRENCHE